MKKQINITEKQLNEAIIRTANRLIREGQGFDMAMDGIRSALGKGKKWYDQYPLPKDRFKGWDAQDDAIADNNMGMDYYDGETGEPTSQSSRAVDNGDGGFEIEDNPKADNSWLGRTGRRLGMKVHDGAMKLGAKLRDWKQNGTGYRSDEEALEESILRRKKMLHEAKLRQVKSENRRRRMRRF